MKRVFLEINVPTLEVAEALRDHFLNEVTTAQDKFDPRIELVDSGVQDEPFGVTPRELTMEDVKANDTLLSGIVYPLGFEDLDDETKQQVLDFLNLVRSWQ